MPSVQAQQGVPSEPSSADSPGTAPPPAPGTTRGEGGAGYDWLARLGTNASLADLPGHDCQVGPSEPGARVAALLDAHGDLPGVIVAEAGSAGATDAAGAAGSVAAGGRFHGVLSRAAFFRRMSQRFSRELYLTRPIKHMLLAAAADGGGAALRLSADCPVGEAARRLLERPLDFVYEPLLVERADGSLELLDAYAVLLAQARVLAVTQVAMVQNEKLASLGQLAAGVAHEINNPLAFVGNNLAVIQRDLRGMRGVLDAYRGADAFLAGARPDLAAAVREAAEAIDLEYTVANLHDLLGRSRQGLQRIQAIVRDLRDFARLDESDLHEVDLNDGIRSAAHLLARRAAECGVQVKLELADLPPVACYPARINQVVMNLASNAIEACQPGGTVHIRSRPDPAAGGVVIEVQDDGAGIDPAIQPRIFDPFFTTKPPGNGTGLGLSVSYGIVRDHRGRIDFSSRPGPGPGHGSTFQVFLPVSRPGH